MHLTMTIKLPEVRIGARVLSIKARPNLIKAAYEFTLLDFAYVSDHNDLFII